MAERYKVEWEKFFSDPNLSWEDKEALYPTLMRKDERIASQPEHIQRGFFARHKSLNVRAQETSQIEQTGMNLMSAFPPQAGVAPTPAILGDIGRVIFGAAPELQRGRQLAAAADSVADQFGGLPSAITSGALTVGDTAYEMARRLPKSTADTAAQRTAGTGANLNTLFRLAAARRGGVGDGPGPGDRLVEMGTDQEARLPMPEQMAGTGWIPEMAGEITAQLPILSAIAMGNLTAGPAGGFTASQTLLTGQVAERMAEETGEVSSPMASTLGALGAVPEQLTFLKALKKVKGSTSPGYLKRVFDAGIGEGMTEALQQELERLGVHWLDPNFEVFSREGLTEMAYAAKQGMTLGWLMGAVGIGSSPDPDALAYDMAQDEKRRKGLQQPRSSYEGVEAQDQIIYGAPQKVRFTDRDIDEGAFKNLKEGYVRVNRTKDGQYDVQMFNDFDEEVSRNTFATLNEANEAASEGIGVVAPPEIRAVKADYMAQNRPNVAATVRQVEVSDPQIDYVRKIAEDSGVKVNFYTDLAETDQVRAISNPDGSLSVRFDKSQPEATSAAITQALMAQKLKTDPAVTLRTAQELESSNPRLWEEAKDLADSNNPVDIVAKAADLSFRDVITAMEHPVEVSKAAQSSVDFAIGKLAKNVEAKLSNTMRAALNHLGLEFALPNARTGGLLSALRDQPGYIRLAQDIEGMRSVARSAEALGGVMRDVVASEFDPSQPLIIRGKEGDRTGADIDLEVPMIDKRSAVYNLLNRVIYPNMGIEEVEKRLKEGGAVIDDTVASAQERDLRSGKTVDFIERAVNDFYRPMVNILKADGRFNKDRQELYDRFLQAWSAEERNRVLRLRGDKGHSGMTDETIEGVYREVDQLGLRETFTRAAQYLVNMHDRVLDLAIQEGVISRVEANQMRSTYKRYLPLRLVDEGGNASNVDSWMDEMMGIDPMAVEANQGISRELFHEVEGRKTEGISPVIEESIHQLVYRTQEIRRSASIRKLANLARRYESDLIRVEDRRPSRGNAGRALPTEIGFREDGKYKTVILKPGMGLHTGLVEISPRKRDVIGKALQKTTRFMSSLATTMSPAFWFANLPRDLLTAGLQTDSAITPEEIYANLGKVATNLMARELDGDPKNLGKGYDEEVSRYIDEAAEHGMFMSIMGLREMKEITEVMFKEVDPGKMMSRSPMSVLRWFVSFMENASGVIENTTRLSGYIAARKAGYTADQAAKFGKALTVDFGRRTEWSSGMNDYFMFFNAGVQGTSRIFETAWRSKEGRARMRNLIGMAAALAFYNETFGGDDEDTEDKNWVKMQDSYDRLSHLIVMKPDFSGEYWKIPVPPGITFLTNLGYKLNDLSHGRTRGPFDEALELFSSTMEEFSPLSGGRLRTSGYFPVGRHLDWHQASRWLLPDPLRPIMDVVANKNQWGTPVRPERFGRSDVRPDSELYFKNVSPAIKWVTDRMNEFGAGSKTYPGELFGIDTSYSPETLEHLLTGYTTGLGQSFIRGTKLSHKILIGEEINREDVPIFRRFQGEQSDFNIRDEYYAIVADLKAHDKTWKAYSKDYNSVPIEDFNKRHGWKGPFVDLMKSVEKSVNATDDYDEKLRIMKKFVLSYQDEAPE